MATVTTETKKHTGKKRTLATQPKAARSRVTNVKTKSKAEGAIIFLDIDGVLNCMPDNHRQVWPDFKGGYDERAFGINPELAANLKTVIDRTDAKIVVSSSWRHFEDYFPFDKEKKWRDVLAEKLGRKAEDLFIGSTGALSFYEYLQRGGEIKQWMIDNEEKYGMPGKDYRYCIIDDEVTSILRVFKSKYVVHTSHKTGFTEIDAEIASHILRYAED